jgi:sugar-specific transcriptional regulator TrmB
MLIKILQEVGIPKNASLIYIKLKELGFSSVRQIANNLGLPRATIYDNLKVLMQNQLIVERKEDGKRLFGLNDPINLENLLQSKIEKLLERKRTIKNALKDLNFTNAFEPKIKFYSGAEGIRRVLNDLLWYENIETLTMWPISEMVEILGRDYLENLNRRRIRNNISIRGIWPANKTVNLKEFPFLGVGNRHLRQLRIAPKEMSWNMSYWLYEDKVAFISSEKECFGFVIHSRDFASLIKSNFEMIWKLSNPVRPQPKYTDQFLNTI